MTIILKLYLHVKKKKTHCFEWKESDFFYDDEAFDLGIEGFNKRFLIGTFFASTNILCAHGIKQNWSKEIYQVGIKELYKMLLAGLKPLGAENLNNEEKK